MKPNILIISIDSLSHQRLFTELKSAQTPNIDKLAKNGTTFEQCISSADGTELSWISLFTSQYPIQKSSSKSLTRFDFENKTHFHFLKNSGYHVYGIIPEGGVLFGLEDIFENNDPGYTSEFRIYDGLGNKILKEFPDFNLNWLISGVGNISTNSELIMKKDIKKVLVFYDDSSFDELIK